jgi:hypothetical protein
MENETMTDRERAEKILRQSYDELGNPVFVDEFGQVEVLEFGAIAAQQGGPG